MSTVVYEVPANASGGAVRRMHDSELPALDARAHSLQEIVVVASLLATVPKFPLDMLDEVLLLADFLVTFEAATQELCPGRSDMNHVYLELSLPSAHELMLPPGVTVDPHCVELMVECSSHDQGWASQDNEHDGTYVASFTWSEIAVVKHSVDDQDTANEVARQPVTVNVRAQRQFRHHLKRFTASDGLLANVALGDTLQLILRSQYPGWTNAANYGRLRARFRVEICEDAQLLTILQLQHLKQLQQRSNATESVDGSASAIATARTVAKNCTLQ